MTQMKSVNEILDFAIHEEEEAAKFYTALAKKMKNPAMQKVFKDFAKEEEGHKTKLLEVKQGKQLLAVENKILNLKLADYLVDITPSADMEYQEALIVAMKKEKKAFQMYLDLSNQVDNPGVKNLFLSLAQEEAKHKLRFEIEYDDTVLKDN